MIIIEAYSASDLIAKLAAIEIEMPLRSEGRTTVQCERWSICRILATYAKTDLIQYPMQVNHGDRPDFLLSLPSKRIGIEITEALHPDWARVQVHRDEKYPNQAIYLQNFIPGDPRRSKKEIDDIASGKTMGEGWVGDQPEREWADVMFEHSFKKAEKFTGYEKFNENWLVMYDNWPLPGVKHHKSSRYFMEKISKSDRRLPFDRIFIDCDNAIWQFLSSSYSPQPINDLWKNR